VITLNASKQTAGESVRGVGRGKLLAF